LQIIRFLFIKVKAVALRPLSFYKEPAKKAVKRLRPFWISLSAAAKLSEERNFQRGRLVLSVGYGLGVEFFALN
jgi:hypothetical protein